MIKLQLANNLAQHFHSGQKYGEYSDYSFSSQSLVDCCEWFGLNYYNWKQFQKIKFEDCLNHISRFSVAQNIFRGASINFGKYMFDG